MIKDRPAHLLSDPAYSSRPAPPYAFTWGAVPELVVTSLADLSGIQPVTGAMMRLAGGLLRDQPSDPEIAMLRERGTKFQIVSVVASVVATHGPDGVTSVTPFALSLIPASKRGEVTATSIDSVAGLLAGESLLKTEPAYVGYDPFSGDWSLYRPLGLLTESKAGYLDELGIVVGMYFLATEFDSDDVLMTQAGMPSERLEQKYRRRRGELLFKPFERVEARRVWGTETPIELFLVQELARHGLHPNIQMLVMGSGDVFPSWYHLWRDLEFRQAPELVTEADLFFPDERVAVFCDGSHHERRKQRLKDASIDTRLTQIGIFPVRVSGRLINEDLEAAGRAVIEAVQRRQTEMKRTGAATPGQNHSA